MEFLPVAPASLEKGAQIIKNGGLVAFPTETVYGLGADAFNPNAIAKIFEVKNRPHFDPLIIHIASVDSLEKTADISLLNDDSKKKLFLLAENLWPGPLSIVLPKNKKIPGIASAGLQTAAIRFPDNEAAQKLISLSTGAIAAPSANPFGSLSPTRARHVLDSLGDKISMILDGGVCKIGLESTVLDITGSDVKILRPGGTPKETIEKLIGAVSTCAEHIPNPSSPGQLKSHYAPKTPLKILSREEIIRMPPAEFKGGDLHAAKKTAFLFFDGGSKNEWDAAQEKLQHKKNQGKPQEPVIVKILSEKGGLLEAASMFFDALHELDACNASIIFAQEAPNKGLGEAINDRLLRASS